MDEPAAAVVVAMVMNTLVKLALAWTRGARAFRRDVAVALGAMTVVGTAAGIVVYLRW